MVQVGVDYGIWDYSQNQAVDVNSTTFKDPAWVRVGVVIHGPSRVWFRPGKDEKITEVTVTLPTYSLNYVPELSATHLVMWPNNAFHP